MSIARRTTMAAAAAAALLTSCATPPPPASTVHLGTDAARKTVSAPAEQVPIPPTVDQVLVPPAPRERPKPPRLTVVVNQVEIADLLFAIARDARIDADVDPAVRGKVSLNAVDQTLPQILARLARQVDLRYEFDGKTLVVSPDRPFVRHYTVEYLNVARETRSQTALATQIATTGGAAAAGGSSASNNSTAVVDNVSNNRFWASLVAAVEALLGIAPAPAAGASAAPAAAPGTAPALPAADSPGAGVAQAPSGAAGLLAHERPAVIATPETGLLTVRATQRQHERVQALLERVTRAARRQVLIEATIAEVELSDEYEQGINWSRVRLDGTGLAFTQQPNGTLPLPGGAQPGSGPGGIVFPTVPDPGSGLPGGTQPGGATDAGAPTPSLGVLRYLMPNSRLGSIGVAVSLLQSFGKVKVLSSPKLSVLNNQTAVLKVVDNQVYFTVNVNITPGTSTSAPVVTYTSTPNTVPVGFVMGVTAQIEEHGEVTMIVRPTISRVLSYVNDPNPALAQARVTSRVPVIQTRELESIMKIGNGDIAVLGGLMQDSLEDRSDGVPGVSETPVVGELFRYRAKRARKTELVVFLRPTVVSDASIDGDYAHLKSLLPGADFFGASQQRAGFRTRP